MSNKYVEVLKRVCLILVLTSSVLSCAKQLVGKGIDKSAAAKSHVSAALAYIEEGNSREALRHLQKAESFEEKSSELFHTYALMYSRESDYEQEGRYFKKALKADKKNAKVLNNYGAFLCRQGSHQKGLKLLQKASEDYSYSGRAEAFVNRGVCELSSEDKELAEKSFQQALRLSSRSLIPYIELAEIYYDKNEIKLSRMYYQQFINKVSSKSARSLWLGIRIENKLGDKNAMSSYALALKSLYPDSSEYKAYQTLVSQ